MSYGMTFLLNSMKPHERYALPLVGSTYRNVDQYADYQKMYNDYMRNVGRKIKYPSIRDFRSNAYSSLGNATTFGMKAGLRTTRFLV